ENILFAFAAAPGETAADGSGQNSPFTAALTKYLGTDGLEIRSVLTLVQQEVYDLSRGKQLPYVESGLPQLFFAATTKEQLPERERLLLAMADVTPEMRGEVEQIASDADMPLAPLYGALISTDTSHLSGESLNARLREAADAFVKV
ncbi:MAG: peptidase C14, partial [Mesorhizobium sp.]